MLVLFQKWDCGSGIIANIENQEGQVEKGQIKENEIMPALQATGTCSQKKKNTNAYNLKENNLKLFLEFSLNFNLIL